MRERVPEGWKVGELSEISSSIRGVSYKPDNLRSTKSKDTATLLRSNNIQEGGLNFDNVQYVEVKKVKSKQRVIDGDIAVCMSNGSRRLVGKNAIFARVPLSETFTVGAFCSIIRTNGNSTHEFVRHLLKSNSYAQQVDLSLAGSAINNLKDGDVEDYSFLLPPLPEQKKIASILTSVDEVIETTQRQIDKLQDLKKATMNELLTKGIGHTEFKDSELGRIPESWEVHSLQDIASKDRYAVVGGPFGSDLTSKDYVSVNGVPVIRGGNLTNQNGLLNEKYFVYVSPVKATALSRNTATKGDFVFTQRGTMGQVAIIPSNSKFNLYVISQSQMKLSSDDNIINKQFLMSWVTSEIFLRKIDERTIATGLPHINLGILKDLPILLPSLEEQRVIAKKLYAIFDYTYITAYSGVSGHLNRGIRPPLACRVEA